MPKVRKAELSFLNATHRLVLFYSSTKYHKIFQRVFDLQSGHEINGLSLSNKTKGHNAKSKKTELSFLTQHVVWSCSTFLPSIIKIFQGVFDLQSGYEINGYHCQI